MQPIQKNLLYLEDDLNLASVHLKILSLFFQNVTHAPNGLEGLEAYDSNTFDLILSDIQMPIMDGLEFVARIREKNKEIPIYLLSSLLPNPLPKELNITQAFQKPNGMKNFIELFSTF